MHKIEAEHFTQMTFFSPRKKKQKRVRDDFKAFLVEGARFTSIEQYPIIEMPIYRMSMRSESFRLTKLIVFQI